jgi:hypothetical protein
MLERLALAAALACAACNNSTGLAPPGGDGGGDLAGGGGGDLASGGGDDLAGGGSDGGGGACGPMSCGAPFMCCGDTCTNPDNDPFHCGGCSNVCTGAHPFCNGGGCAQMPPCPGGLACFTGFCCGDTCCNDGQLCCDVQGPGPSFGPTCYTPTVDQPTCPLGCPLCN